MKEQHEIIKDERIKNKCQTFTPLKIVKKLLDVANYKKDLYGKTVLENSCGEGDILCEIVKRYISDCKLNGLTNSIIRNGLEKDIYAFDIDEKCLSKAINRVQEIASLNGIENVNWNIYCKDYLTTDNSRQYSFIIGNPPYVSYLDLPKSIRSFIKSNYQTCAKGKFDYYYAFIEKAYNQLLPHGKMVYIIPSNLFKNVFAKEVRSLVLNDLVAILDFPVEKVFSKVLVSPAIISVEKDSSTGQFKYNNKNKTKVIQKNRHNDKWLFDSSKTTSSNKISDYFKVSSSIATLYNKAYILKDLIINDDYYTDKNGNRFEKEIIKKAASPKNYKSKKHNEYIIFPYYYQNGKLLHYDENEFEEKFPFAYAYLLNYKEKLNNRDSDTSSLWFEYGRSQAIQHMNQRKIMISSVISNCTEGYLLEDDIIPYSGLYIISKGNEPLENLVDILNSDNFKKHILNVGVCVSGNSRRITPKDIEEYKYYKMEK
ncbi:MAG: SAM-dependent methyltransferase [Ruminococcaceae bacterium]|nr:SAM-dependent methyltransferase [Oscillospiraceae bacterium]